MKSKRLNYILNLIDCNTLVDVGCDHGLLGLNALIENKANKVIFLDISSKSLNKSVNLIKKYKLLDRSVFIQADGLKDLKEYYDQVVIAGLGADEIIKILNSVKYSGKAVLAPHSKPQKLRKYLNGQFLIKSDNIIEENNRFYPIIAVDSGSSVYTNEQLFLGLNSSSTKDYDKMVKVKYKSMRKILDTEVNISANFLKEFNIIEKEYKMGER